MMEVSWLFFFGLITGAIDSVVGGGGLISLPVLSIAISPGAHAIGTNKIIGTVGALTALLVYARNGHLRIAEGFIFCFFCALGSYAGSMSTPHIPKDFFRYMLLFMCPVIIYIVWNKEKFFSQKENFKKSSKAVLIISALASGFYDGFFGPGGGTFMFLSLFLTTGLPLLPAIAISKLANTFSAGTALVTYSINGFVHWKEGSMMATGMALGSFVGASYANKNAIKIVRPMLILIVMLLMIKLIFYPN